MAIPSYDEYRQRAEATYPGVTEAQVAEAYRANFGADPVSTQGPTLEQYATRARQAVPGVTDEQIQEAYHANFGTGIGTELKRAVKSGYGAFGELVGATLGGLGADELGASVRDYWRESQARNAPSTETQDASWLSPRKLAVGTTQTLTSIIPSIGIGGGVGLLAARLGAPLALAMATGTTAGATVGGAQEGYPLYVQRKQELMAGGMPEAEADAQAKREGVMQGLASAALNAVPLGRILRRIPGRLATALLEGATETAEGTTQALITGKDPVAGTIQEAKDVFLPAFLTGGLLGGGAPSVRERRSARDEFLRNAGLDQPSAPGSARPEVPPSPTSVPYPSREELAGLTEAAAATRMADIATERRTTEPGGGLLGPEPAPAPSLEDQARARIEAQLARRSLGESALGLPENAPEPISAPPATVQPTPPTSAQMPAAEALALDARAQQEMAARRRAMAAANQQPGMAPEEVAALDAQVLPERGLAPAAPEAAPPAAPAPADVLSFADAQARRTAAAQGEQERQQLAAAAARASQLSQPIQIRLARDPDLRATLAAMRPEIGWVQQGGKARIHPDTWYDLPHAEAEKMRARNGSTEWVSKSQWWRARPMKINERDSLAAVDAALTGGKLKPNQRKFLDYMESIYRERQTGADVREPGAPAYAGERQPSVASPNRAYARKGVLSAHGQQQQLAFNFETRPDTTPEQARLGSAALRTLIALRDRRAGASVLADGVTRDFTERGHTSLLGQSIGSAADLATLAQVYRDPRIETLRVIYTRAGVVVGQTGHSARLPGAASFPSGTPAAQLIGQMRALGADGYWLLHNHPSGRATPSASDETFTAQMRTIVPGLQGHVIVDHNEYATISRDGRTDLKKANFGGYHPRQNPRLEHPVLGVPISSPMDLAGAAARIKAALPDSGVVIATDSAGRVAAVVEYPRALLKPDTRLAARLRWLRAAGGAGGHLFLIAEPSVYQPAYEAGYFDEATRPDGSEFASLTSTSPTQWRRAREAKDQLNRMRVSERGSILPGVADQGPTDYTTTAPPAPEDGKIHLGGGVYAMLPHSSLTAEERGALLAGMSAVEAEVAMQRRAGTQHVNPMELLNRLLERRAGENVQTSQEMGALIAMVNGATREASALAERYVRTRSTEDKLQLLAARERLGVMIAPFMGYRSEAGRTLAMLSRARTDLIAAQDLFEKMAGGEDAAIDDYAKRLQQAGGDPAKVAGITRNVYQPTWWDKFYEYWINGILSGPLTHAANILSNTSMIGVELATEGAANLASREGSMAEFDARLRGVLHGVAIGARNAVRAAITGEPQLTPMTQVEERKGAIGGTLGKVVRTPSRLLMAEDEFFKAIWYHGELGARAMREARKSANPKARFDQIMGGINGRPDLIRAARDAADRVTFQTPLGPWGSGIMQLRRKVKPVGLVVPFVRTPVNILKTAITYTPGALAFADVRAALMGGGHDQAAAAARVLIGSSLMAAMVQLAVNGLLTGNGPDDPRERALWLRDHQPYSLKVDGQWQRFSRFDPMATLLGVAGDYVGVMNQARVHPEEADKIAAMAVAAFTLQLADKTFLKGVFDFSNALSDPARYMRQWAGSMAGSLIPNVIAQPTREADPFLREARTLLDQVRARIPGQREQLAAKLDIAGEDIENPGGKFVWPVQTSTPKDDRLAATMLELGVFKDKPERWLSRGGVRVEMSDAQYHEYAQMVQRARYRVLTPIVNSPQFQALKARAPLVAAQQLERLWDRIGDEGRLRYLVTHRELAQELAGARARQAVHPSGYVR